MTKLAKTFVFIPFLQAIMKKAWLSWKKLPKSAGFDFLDKVVGVLESRPELFVKIQGHTDRIGSKAYNDTLSLERAKAVKSYLVDRGIDENRLSCEKLGFSKTVESNKTDKGRALNRRVELYPMFVFP
jgi:OOP family OmpA-OmpF porin